MAISKTHPQSFDWKAWIQASRLPSQTYIFVPIFMGQVLGAQLSGAMDWGLFVIAQLMGVFCQLYIVYANDIADQETDSMNHSFNIFSGGSRVLVQKRLSSEGLTKGTYLVIALGFAVSFATMFAWKLILAPVFFIACLVLLWMYSFRPFQLSYRGGGEILQMVGVGTVLPAMGFYFQSGSLGGFPIDILGFILPTQLACAFSTTIPDYYSDEVSQKKTISVMLKPSLAGQLILLLQAIAIAVLFTSSLLPVWMTLSLISLLIGSGIALNIGFQNRASVFCFVMGQILVTTLITLSPVFT